MSTLRIAAPMVCISAKVNLSPRAKLQGAHEGSTLPLMCGSALSILSKPRGVSVVPQCTQGLTISAYTSAVERSQASMRSYALRKNTARPLSVCPYFLFLAVAAFRCSGVKSAHRSVRLSLPALRALWQILHSYARPSGRDLSRKKNSEVAALTSLHRWQRRLKNVFSGSLFMPQFYYGPHKNRWPK